MKLASTTFLFALLLLAVLPGCDSADPAGPRNLQVTIAAPTQLEVGQSGAVTVTALRPDGNPAAGEPLTLSTTLGALEDTSLVLDSEGRAMTTFEAGDASGSAEIRATVTSGGEPSSASVTVEIVDPPQPPGELEVQPRGLDLIHSRAADPCPNPYQPLLALTNVGEADLDYEVGELPVWLEVDSPTGQVPAMLEVSFTCDVEDGDQDLEHMLQIQGIDRASRDPVGDPAVVTVTVQVRE